MAQPAQPDSLVQLAQPANKEPPAQPVPPAQLVQQA
jgi:hypothetical protein